MNQVLRYFHKPPKLTVLLNSQIQQISNTVLNILTELNTKVDKFLGKGLTENNYTNLDRNKLKSIEDGAEVNVQADWNEQDIQSDSYIKNKPSIPILNESGQIPAAYLPSYVDDVLEYDGLNNFPTVGEIGKIYVDVSTDLTYRWSGTTYVEISKSIVTGVKGSAETDYRIGNINLTAANIGLGSVVNLDQSKAIKSISRNGLTFTYTCLDGSTGTFTQQDTVYTLPLASSSTRGGVKTGYTTNGKNYPVLLSNEQMYVNVPWTDTTYNAATQSAAGLMSADDKKKLDGVANNANNYTYTLPLSTSSIRGGVKIGYTANGKNYPVQLNNEQMYVNVPWTDTTYSSATLSAAGLMSKEDKTKLDGIAANANNYTYTLPTASSSVKGGIKTGYTQSGKNYPVQMSGENAYVNVPWTDTNTTYSFTDNNPTLSWSTKSKVATVGGVDIHVTMPANPNTWPTKVSLLTNDSGYITNSALINYMPYSALNGGLKAVSKTTNWGNQTGVEVASWTDSSGNSAFKFRKDCPSAGKMSLIIDGTVYVNEGNDAIATASQIPTNTNLLTNGAGYVTINHSHSYLPLSGGYLTGVLHLLANQYADTANTGSLNLLNSDIYGVNSIKFADLSDTAAEGLQWYRDGTHVDSFWVNNGTMYFTQNRAYGGTATNNVVLHSGNISSYALTSHQSLSNYVTLDDTQTISGAKTFSSSIILNSNNSSSWWTSSTPRGKFIATNGGTVSGWSPVLAFKTVSGKFEIGSLNDTGYINYYKDTRTTNGTDSLLALPFKTGTLAVTSDIPTNVSQLSNDSGYISSITKAMVESVLTGNITSHTHSQYLTSANIVNMVTTDTAQTISGKKTITNGLKVSGRFTDGGDDEGIVVGTASNGHAGLILGNPTGKRSVFYFNTSDGVFWRFNDGTTSYDIHHPKKGGTIALTSDIPTNTNQLTNGAGFITSSALAPYALASSLENYLPLGGGWMNYQASIYFKGLNNSTIARATMGYAPNIGGCIMHCVSTAGHQASGAFYITSNGCDSYNDNGGLAIDNEGVTVFGAGDAGSNFTGVFRVLNEDNVADGPQFLVTKASGSYVKHGLYVNDNAVWHAGNFNPSNYLLASSYTASDVLSKIKTVDGSGSGLDADLLDGLHNGSLTAKKLSVTNIVTVGVTVATAKNNLLNAVKGNTFGNVATVGAALLAFWDNDNVTTIDSSKYSIINVTPQYNGDNYGQYLLFHYGTFNPAIIGRNDGNWTSVKYLAFTTDNVASATKLQTPRTIWGQSFDGTGNVSGNMTGVGSITASGTISGCTRIYNATSGIIYLGNSDNSGWVMTQDICSQSAAGDSYWSLRTNGTAHFKTLVLGDCTISWNSTNNALKFDKTIYSEGGVSALGFIKSGSSDDYVLLGGGGHKAISDFNTGSAVSGSYVSKAGDTMTGNLVMSNCYIHANRNGRGITFGSGTTTEYIGTDVDSFYIWSESNAKCIKFGTNKVERFRITTDGLISFSHTNPPPLDTATWGTYHNKSLYCEGTVRGSSVVQSSDIRLKNIYDSDKQLDIESIAEAPIITFKWKNQNADKDLHIGTSAQYWLYVLPEVIFKSGADDYLTMDYSSTALVSAITVAKSVVKQEEKIKRLEKQNALLKQELQDIKSQLKDILSMLNTNQNDN